MGGYVPKLQFRTRVTKAAVNRIGLESQTIEGDSPVGENRQLSGLTCPSKAGHEKSRLNPGRPLPKAKY